MELRGISSALGKKMKSWCDTVYGYVRSQSQCQQLLPEPKLKGDYKQASSTKADFYPVVKIYMCIHLRPANKSTYTTVYSNNTEVFIFFFYFKQPFPNEE